MIGCEEHQQVLFSDFLVEKGEEVLNVFIELQEGIHHGVRAGQTNRPFRHIPIGELHAQHAAGAELGGELIDLAAVDGEPEARIAVPEASVARALA